MTKLEFKQLSEYSVSNESGTNHSSEQPSSRMSHNKRFIENTEISYMELKENIEEYKKMKRKVKQCHYRH